jgi:hypothetical protein
MRATTAVENGPSIPTAARILDVYPNPARHRIHVRLDKGLDAVGLDLTDVLGRVVQSVHLGSGTPSTGVVSVHISDLPPGLYAMKLRKSDGDVVGIFVKCP